jgi:hypothetical protein
MIDKETTWQPVVKFPPPVNEYVLIKTKTERVRVAKFIKYPDGEQVFTYASIKYKDVLYWQPLPK